MGATSKHPGDVAIWIERVIDSCQTPLHEIGARALIRQFEKNLIEQRHPNYMEFSRQLRDRLDQKTYGRHA